MLDDEIVFLGTSSGPASPSRPAQRPVTGVSLHVEQQGAGDGYSMMFRRASTSVVHIGRRSAADVDTRSDADDLDSAMFRCAVVSRKHAKIAFSDSGHAYLIDLGSHHGTHIRKPGDKVSKPIKAETPTVLLDGDIVTFGKSVGRGEECVPPVTARIELLHGDTPTFKPLIVPSTSNSPSSHSDRSIARSASGRYGVKGSPSSSSDESSSNIYSDIEEIPPPSFNKPPPSSTASENSNPSAPSQTPFGSAFNVLRRLLPPTGPSQPQPPALPRLPSMTEIVERPLSQMSSFFFFGARDSASPSSPLSPICDKLSSSNFDLDLRQPHHQPVGFDASQHDIYEDIRINVDESINKEMSGTSNNDGDNKSGNEAENDHEDISSSSSSSNSSSSRSRSRSYSPARSNSPMDLASPSSELEPEVLASSSFPTSMPPRPSPTPSRAFLPHLPSFAQPMHFTHSPYPPYMPPMFCGPSNHTGFGYPGPMPPLAARLNIHHHCAPGSAAAAPEIPVVNSPEEEDRECANGVLGDEPAAVPDLVPVAEEMSPEAAVADDKAMAPAAAPLEHHGEAIKKLEGSVARLRSAHRKYKSRFNNNVTVLEQKLVQFDDRLAEVNAEYTMLDDIVEGMHHGDVPELQAQMEGVIERIEELEEKDRERERKEDEEMEEREEREEYRQWSAASPPEKAEDVTQSVQALHSLVDEMKGIRDATQRQLAEELAAIKALREQVAKAALETMKVASSDNQSPVLPSLKRKRDDIDENGEEAASERIDDKIETDVAIVTNNEDTATVLDAPTPPAPSASLPLSIVGVPPPRKRARRVASVLAQTATAVTIGAVVTWSALAFS